MGAIRVELLDVSSLAYEDRLTAASLQGLVNRGSGEGPEGPRLFLDYGTYDDPASRRTNSVMMTEEDWSSRYRRFLLRNDLDNLDAYTAAYGLEVERLASLDEAVTRHRALLAGCVVWDPGLPDSVNAALSLAGLEDLLVVGPARLEWARRLGLEPRVDLRGRFKDRVALYEWAFLELRPRCQAGAACSNEPHWKRPEFADYIVGKRLFAFGLSSYEKGGLRGLGHGLLLFLVAGPWLLRDAAFACGLDAPLRRLALRLLALGSPETALMNTAELGGFRRPERGSVPFNWEVQPLLAELAPALLGLLFRSLTPQDLLVAGPSGAGYVIPPLVPDLPAYFRASAASCATAGIRVVTSYTGDPPRRVLRDHGRAEGFLGFLAGYFHLGRLPAHLVGGRPFVANAWPPVDAIGATMEETMAGIRALVEGEGPLPRFVGCHLFAYRSTVADVAAFVKTLDASKIKVVRGDEFLAAAAIHLSPGGSYGR